LEQQNSQEKNKPTNLILWIGLTVVGIIVIGLIAYLLMRKNKKSGQ